MITGDSFRRVAHFRTFRLPGGEKAVREPRRAAAGLLYKIFGENFRELADLPCLKAFSARELRILTRMLERNINSPLTSSAGRLFDGVAALTGVRQISRFEGQAAMELEFALDGVETEEAYPIKAVEDNSILILDWEPLVREIINDVRRSLAAGEMAAKFHRALAEFIVAAARFAGEKRVVLSGGCFQNRYLTERAVERLRAEGFNPYWHQRVPPNDGGIALGQVVAAAREKI